MPLVCPASQDGQTLVPCQDIAVILDDSRLDDHRKLKAIRGLIAPPESSPLTPVRLA